MSKTVDERKKAGEIFLLPVHEKNVAMFKKLLEVTLPVVYDDKFFKNSCNEWSEFTRILYFKDIPVGAVGGRIELEGGAKRVYITVISVLAAYRGRGLGSALLQEVSEAAAKHADVGEMYVHVHVGNTEAVDFYIKNGFSKDADTLVGYYSMNRGVPAPPDAFVLRKAIERPVKS